MPKLFNKKNLKPPQTLIDVDEVLVDSFSQVGIYSSESKIERRLGGAPHAVFFVAVLAGFIYLGINAFFVQVESGDKFFTKSQENRFLVRSIFPPRGVVYDRFGKAMVENQPVYGVVLSREEFLKRDGNLTDLVKTLSEVLAISPQLLYEAGIPSDNNAQHLLSYTILVQNLSAEQLVPISSIISSTPGLSIFENFRRKYQDPLAFSHLLGFVGKLSEEDLILHPDLDSRELIGKVGIEALYDSELRGHRGKKIVEVDASGKETRFRFIQEPERGSDILVSVDSGLQKFAYETVNNFTQGRKGASVVALDPRDGAIRALVSSPGFNSNSFGHSLSQKEFEVILSDPLAPLFNRALSGEFPSGSTLKPLIAAAALQEGIIDPNKQIYDPGFIEIPNPYHPGEKTIFLDWKEHGWINFYDAIAYSANVYFYMIGGGYKDQEGLGINRINKYAKGFGLGSLLGVDLPGEKPGFIPDPEWKKVSEPNDPIWRIGDTYNVSIGQGGVKVTPLQMAALSAAIINGGKLYRPYIVDSVRDKDGVVIKKNNPFVIHENVISSENLKKVVFGMHRTVTSGTARMLNDVGVIVGAKTGTAQVGSLLPHAWVMTFLPVENPELVVVVMVEHAGEGSTVAVPITRDILKWYVQNQMKK